MLLKDGKAKSFKIHRLVALHFIENPENKPEVNHKTGNKKKNFYKFLEWATESENMKHSYDINKNHACKGESHIKHVLTKNQVIEIRKLDGVYTQKEIGNMYGVSQTLVHNILRNKTWKHVKEEECR